MCTVFNRFYMSILFIKNLSKYYQLSAANFDRFSNMLNEVIMLKRVLNVSIVLFSLASLNLLAAEPTVSEITLCDLAPYTELCLPLLPNGPGGGGTGGEDPPPNRQLKVVKDQQWKTR